MPLAEESTLLRIQREISEVVERENELRKYNRSLTVDECAENDEPLPTLKRAQSVSSLLSNGHSNNNNSKQYVNGTRRFAPNPGTKGVMQRFIKAKGKLNSLSAITRSNPATSASWNSTEVIQPPKVDHNFHLLS